MPFISLRFFFSFFFNDTATSEIYTLSLHDALPILLLEGVERHRQLRRHLPLEPRVVLADLWDRLVPRSEEHTSELQSLRHLVCRLLLEKKKKKKKEYNK